MIKELVMTFRRMSRCGYGKASSLLCKALSRVSADKADGALPISVLHAKKVPCCLYAFCKLLVGLYTSNQTTVQVLNSLLLGVDFNLRAFEERVAAFLIAKTKHNSCRKHWYGNILIRKYHLPANSALIGNCAGILCV